MRKIFGLLFTLALTGALFGQKTESFTLKGKLSNLDGVEKVYLRYKNDEGRVVDSSPVVNGRYRFEGKISSPDISYLRIVYADKRPLRQKDFSSVFLDKGEIIINHKDSFSAITVTGSNANTDYAILSAMLKESDAKQFEIMERSTVAEKNKNQEEIKLLDKLSEDIGKEQKIIYASFLKKNPASIINLYVLQQFAGYGSDMDAKTVESYFTRLPAALRNSVEGKKFADRIDIAKKMAIGTVAMDFTQNDTLGKPVRLSSLRGKYLLVDFWASWCGPCRAENPNIVAAFNKYKDKGFHILGVSLDQPGAQEKWLKAIHDDQLTWTHVSDLKWWDNAVAKQYGIQLIPQNVLLDPQGRIVAKNLNGDRLKEKLAELLTKSSKY